MIGDRIAPTRILILGFTDLEELSATMEEAMQELGTYLLTVVGPMTAAKTTAKRWAEMNGAPYEGFKCGDASSMAASMLASADYLVAKIGGNQNVKNFIMKWKSAGKHGKVVR